MTSILALLLIGGLGLLLYSKLGQVDERLERRLKIVGYLMIIAVLTMVSFLWFILIPAM